MSVFEHNHRARIYHPGQHPYKHPVSDFIYSHPALPGVSNLDDALNYIFTVLYPNSKASVATTAALPTLGNTIGDFRVVDDDGDGKAAGYQWQQREGDSVAKWYKIYDMDWGAEDILSGFLLKTQDLYVYRYGYNDLDSSGVALTSDNAGQHIYGGATANTHLTLHANAGDGVGSQTGFIQLADHTRPFVDSTWDLGTTTYRWRKIWTDVITSGTMTLGDGTITDSSGSISFDNENLSTTGTITVGNMVIATGSITNTGGSISFDNENLSTTGTLASGTHTISTLVLSAGSITDTGGSISFDNENLLTTGTLGAGNTTVTRLDSDNVRIDGNTVSVLNSGGNLILIANGAGVIDLQSAMTTIGQTVTGTLAVTGQLNADNLRLDGNTLSSTNSNGNIALAPNGSGTITTSAKFLPTTDGTLDIGATATRFNDIFFDGSIGDGTTTITQAVIQSLRGINAGVSTGMTIFWTGSQWQPSLPDTEIDHGTLTGLADDDHTQYALLAGRSGGQSLIGGTASGNNLTLESTSNVTKGKILVKDTLAPNTTASYSGSWSGTDLGGTSNKFRHVYTSGEFFGIRLENLSADPSPSSQNPGRIFWNTTDVSLKADTGTAIQRLSLYRFESDTSWNGTDLTKDVTVSGVDATKALMQLKNNANDFEVMFVSLKATSTTNVRITTNVALAAGSYRLILIQ